MNWKGTHSPKTAINYKLPLNRFAEVCGNKPIEQYAVSDIVKYHSWLKTRFSPYYVMYCMTALKSLFRYCRQQPDCYCISPEMIRFERADAKSHRAIPEEEYKKMVSEIPTNEFMPLRDSLVIRLLWETGVRVSELCGLNTSDINPQKRSAIIKTKKRREHRRIIVWSAETHQLLLRYLPIRLELEKQNSATALFIGKEAGEGWSRRITRRTIERITKAYASRAGLKAKITPHCFRHGWAHKRRDQNAPLAFIQRGLGHLSPASTFVYEQYNDPEFETHAKGYLNERNPVNPVVPVFSNMIAAG